MRAKTASYEWLLFKTMSAKKLNTLNMKNIRAFVKLANNVIHIKTVHDYVTMAEQF